MSKKLVAYFSASGVTARKAEQLADVVGADLYEIAPKEPYTRADLDWTNKQARSTVEMRNPSSRPALAKTALDVSAYDTVYIGFPIWWYTAPHIINSFLEQTDLTGKTIVLFATSGGSGIGGAVKDLQHTYPNLQINSGTLVNGKITGDIA